MKQPQSDLMSRFGIEVQTISENEDGSVNVKVDVNERFKEWFMYMHRLPQWDEDYFEQWFLKTLGDYVGVNPNE